MIIHIIWDCPKDSYYSPPVDLGGRKKLSYAKECLDRPEAVLSAVPREKSVILCREALRKAVPVGLCQTCGEWHCGIFTDDAHQ